MFKEPTVLILGAGASWHLGYPTGGELVSNLAKYDNKLLFNYIGDDEILAVLYQLGYLDSKEERFYNPFVFNGIELFKNKIVTKISEINKSQVNFKNVAKLNKLVKHLDEFKPTNIDLFLKYHEEFQTVGKDLIAQQILACEDKNFEIHVDKDLDKEAQERENRKIGTISLLKLSLEAVKSLKIS